MGLNQLRYFYFVAKEGGFTKASKRLKIAQPALSKAVKELEISHGSLLFQRIGKKIRLTKEGGDVFRHCEIIFAQIEKIEALKSSPRDGVYGPLKLGAAEGISASALPAVLLQLFEEHPALLPVVVSGAASDVCTRIQKKEIEFALLLHVPSLPDDLEIRSEYPVIHKLVVAQRLLNSSAVLSRFLGSREVDDMSSYQFPALKRLQRRHPTATIVVSTNSLTAHKALVLGGLGVSILPKFIIEEDIRSRKLAVLFSGENFVWPIKLVCRKDYRISTNAQAFLLLFEHHAQKWAP